MNPANAREVALAVVRDVFGNQARTAQGAFDVRARRAELDARDRGFAAELAYGSIKARRRLDWRLAPYVGDRMQTLPPTIVEILRLGIYQLDAMSGVEPHAAVSETVNLAWRHGHRGTAGLVNAVLRKVIADGPREPVRADFASDDDYAGVRSSVPTWIAAKYRRAYGDQTQAALDGINERPQHAIRVNALGASVPDVRDVFEARGAHVAQSAFVPESLVVDGVAPSDDPDGRWSVQSEAAAMAVDLLAPQRDERVLELCSGRGNKSVQLAARLAGTGSLACIEIDEKKVATLTQTLERAGVAGVAVVRGDARAAANDVIADAVLLDAPCSGLGILGRHPEARWRKDPADGARLATLQAELLKSAAGHTAPGGRLVYAVCSNDAREGREIVDAFLALQVDFSRAPLPERYAALDRDGDVVVVAGVDGRDGFYIASLRRR